MAGLPGRVTPIQRFVLEHLAEHPADIAKVAGDNFGVTRQAINRQIRSLAAEGLLTARGKTQARRYEPSTLRSRTLVYDISPGLQEDVVWRQDLSPLLSDVSQNVRDICQFGLTEMVNNAIDHSGSDDVSVTVTVTAGVIELSVMDEGIGIFRKIKEGCNLEDERQAILELNKGKLTTDPGRHTGEGIFFTSRVFDEFSILSGTLFFAHRRAQFDWLSEDRTDASPGTSVSMHISPWSSHTTTEVFDRYATSQDDYAFSRTHVHVALAETETEKLVSRSQAKRVMGRLDRFKDISLDFKGVETLGPAFADELFRVFRLEHPNITIRPINANAVVDRMIRRAMAAAADEAPRPPSDQ